MKLCPVVGGLEVREEEGIADLRTSVNIRRPDPDIRYYVVGIDADSQPACVLLRWDPQSPPREAACEPCEIYGVRRLEQSV